MEWHGVTRGAIGYYPSGRHPRNIITHSPTAKAPHAVPTAFRQPRPVGAVYPTNEKPEMLNNEVASLTGNLGAPDFWRELARLGSAIEKLQDGRMEIPSAVDRLSINPTLQLLQPSWTIQSSIAERRKDPSGGKMKPEEWVLVWKDPRTGEIRADPALEEDLLVLKMVVEGIDPGEVAAKGGFPVGAVDRALDRAVRRGILLAPRSLIRRDPATFPAGEGTEDLFLSARAFTLQWHITQACDLHCKHCYDRSDRYSPTLDQAVEILDDLRSFCRSRYVKGQVSFSGGNPLLYPHLTNVYRATSDRGFAISILGNPAPREQIEELLAIQRPTFFQVSLEGLPEHNDQIRGAGNFKRTSEFLGVLRDLGVPSTVMLTLTKENIDQVLPLAEMLRGLADSFTFNRLSPVEEGAKLELAGREEFAALLDAYLAAAAHNPIMGLKDNLFNIVRRRRGLKPSGGCSGCGCGAAFNFLSLLADGEVHACRKFPSRIGNAFAQGLSEIYESEMARRYRAGCSDCRDCVIRPVCGGCLAVGYGTGLDILEERDPYCFMQKGQSNNRSQPGMRIPEA